MDKNLKQKLVEKERYSLDDLLTIMHILRKECPWDAKQTHHSLRPYLLEETYEVLEQIDQQNWRQLAGELGDLLLQIVFHSEIGREEGTFSFDDVVQHIAVKLIERHPHVFASGQAASAEQVQQNWEHHKVNNEKRTSLLSGVPQSAPALLQAQRLQEKAATVGFDWNEVADVLEKFNEEWREFLQAVEKRETTRIAEEMGDLFFTLVNIARFFQLNAEDVLRKANQKFIRRFQYVESQFQRPEDMKKAGLSKLDEYWEQAKKNHD